MNNVEAVETNSLLSCFFTECEKSFRFLEQGHGFTYYSGLAECRDGRLVIQPYDPDEYPGDHNEQAITFYEKGNMAFEISYNREKFLLDLFLYVAQVYRLELFDLLKAGKRDTPEGLKSPLHVRPADLSKTLHELGAFLQKNGSVFNPDAKTLERALLMREKLIEEKIREQYRQAMDSAREHASRAFLHQDYRQVVFFLTPFAHDLGPADAKKLTLARKKLISV